MNITFLCLFPNELQAGFNKGLIKKAVEKNLVNLTFVDIRDFADDKHKKVDDYPFAHRNGMLLKVDVLYKAITAQSNYKDARIIYTSPAGKTLTHNTAKSYFNDNKDLIIIAGYYEGIDARLFELLPIECVSIGDVILTSGELPALMIAESVLRFIPGVLGNEVCVDDESFHSGVLEAPQYTQPKSFNDHDVPELIRSGDHGKIAAWERKKSLEKTLFTRPDLLAKNTMSKEDREYIVDILTH